MHIGDNTSKQTEVQTMSEMMQIFSTITGLVVIQAGIFLGLAGVVGFGEMAVLQFAGVILIYWPLIVQSMK